MPSGYPDKEFRVNQSIVYLSIATTSSFFFSFSMTGLM